jgi:hypothetical protein
MPATGYEYLEFKRARGNIDCHVEFDKHYYSVPYQLVKTQVEIQASRVRVAIVLLGVLAFQILMFSEI